MKVVTVTLAACALLLGGARQARANLVMNGSFEAVQIGSPFFSDNAANIPFWTHTGTQGDALMWAIGYSDGGGSITVAGQGRQFVTMGGGFGPFGTSHWEQLLTGLTVGDTYTLNFKMAAEAGFSGPQSITVDFPTGSSTTSQTFTAATPPANYWRDWEQKTMSFVATDTSVDLRFTASTQFDVGLDDVDVELTPQGVPEPASITLLGLGMAAMAGYRWRRRVSA
jgi:hypothetical protein